MNFNIIISYYIIYDQHDRVNNIPIKKLVTYYYYAIY